MGTNDRIGFVRRLEALFSEKNGPIQNLDDAMKPRTFEILPSGGMEGRTRAMLKVEDGCVNFCTYCIIPYARGPVRSLSLPQARKRPPGWRRRVFGRSCSPALRFPPGAGI